MIRKTANDSGKSVSKRVMVTIHRDITQTLSKICWQHELPILAAVHDADPVVIDPSVLDEGFTAKPSSAMQPYNRTTEKIVKPSEASRIGFVFVGDARAEYDRLNAVYGNHPQAGTPMAEYIYGRFSEGRFESMVGGAEVNDLPVAQLKLVLTENGIEAADIAKALTREDLVKLATDKAVELA